MTEKLQQTAWPYSKRPVEARLTECSLTARLKPHGKLPNQWRLRWHVDGWPRYCMVTQASMKTFPPRTADLLSDTLAMTR